MDESAFRAARGAANPRFDLLVETVQGNCHITDARHARNMTLCTYLLEMRELYRWENGVPLTEPLSRSAVGAWLSDRETLWSRVEGDDYRPLPVDDCLVEPFDVQSANRMLVPRGFVYGAGIGRFGKPQFFLGALEREEWREGARILVSRCEYARDLAPMPAALRDGTIYVRLESLQRVLWEKAEAWAVKRPDGALKSALDAHGFAADPDAALASMTAAEGDTLILHELGEHRAAAELGPPWERMLAGLASRRAELFVRAVRDHLADCTTTLPALLARDAPASLHFWFANLDGMRRELFPHVVAGYEAWRDGDGGRALHVGVVAGATHWRDVCAQVLALYERDGPAAERAIEALASAPGTRF